MGPNVSRRSCRHRCHKNINVAATNRSTPMTQDIIKTAQRPRRRRSYFHHPSHSLLLPIILSLACFALLNIQPASSLYLPLQIDIRSRHTHCIYARFERGDFATFEVFVVDAENDGRPQVGVQIEGPVTDPKVGKLDENGDRQWDTVSASKPTMGAAMQVSIDKWPEFIHNNHDKFGEMGIIHHAYHIDYTHSGETEDAIAARADISRKKKEEIEERRQRNLERERRRKEGDESVDDEEYEEETRIQQIIPEWYEPYEWTKPIKLPGWYRLCANADNAVAVEMDIRSSADLGGIDPETGHVYTYDERELIDEEERIMGKEQAEEEKLIAEELEKALKDQVSDYDLDATRTLMAEVNRLVSDMMKQQQSVHARIKGHEHDSRRNYRGMVRSGTIETVLYVVITLIQVYTIRKWLLSNTVLGR